MSDNEDLLGEDLGDHSLADYNLGNDEEDQLLADDYDCGPSQNVPTSIGRGPGGYGGPVDIVPNEYTRPNLDYRQPMAYLPPEAECVVPNITVEVPNTPLPEHSTYAPYSEPAYEQDHAVVPTPIPAGPVESPQIVPSEITPTVEAGRERLPQRVYTHRAPLPRNIPDSLDKVFVPRNAYGGGRGRNSWRNPHYRQNHPYRRNNVFRANFTQRPSFPPPQIRPQIPNPPQIREEIPPQNRPEIPPQMSPERPPILPPERQVVPIEQPVQPERVILPPERPIIPPERQILPPERPIFARDVSPERRMISPDRRMMSPERSGMSPERPILHPDRPPFYPDRPILHPDRPMLHPDMPIENPNFPRYQFRNEERFGPNMRPNFGQHVRPNFERPMFYRPYNPRQFGPPIREIIPNNNLPQVTIRQPMPVMPAMKGREREPEVRMLPVLPPNLPNLPPGGLAGKKVLINPHFKGNFQPPVDGFPAYIPTRIQKTPPLSPTLESKFGNSSYGPIKDIDDAAERFIAEQRNALAKAANRKFARRSPQRYIENTTIEIENDLARGPPPRRRSEDEDLLRRQEEFINANRAGLRRRMRSPSPPRRSPERRPRPQSDEESEYRRKVREQETLRERVLRAKEVRRRKNAVALQKHLQEREKEKEKEKEEPPRPVEVTPIVKEDKPTTPAITEQQQEKPDTTRKTPEKEKVEPERKRERSPIKVESAEANSTCGDNLTPPRESIPQSSPERALTPPLPKRDDKRTISDDELDLILDDIDDILSDDDDTGRFKEKAKKVEPAPKTQVDLRSKLPPKNTEAKKPRQKIVFHDAMEERKKKEKSPPTRTALSGSNKNTIKVETKVDRVKTKVDVTKTDTLKSRQKITFDKKEPEKEKDEDKPKFPNRRVILQRKIQTKEKSVFSRIDKNDPTKPNPGIFSRAVRTAIGSEKTRIVVKNEPTIEYESGSDVDEDKLLEEYGMMAIVTNLPHGMTDTRLNTLAGNDVQNLSLDKEERSAKITFKTTIAAENFKKKFNNKMVAASRLTVTLR